MSISQQRPEELNSLVAITEILTGRLPFLEKCDSVLAVLADLTGSELVTLRELDSENSTLGLVASHNHLVPPESVKLVVSVSAALPARDLNAGTPVVVNDYPATETPIQGYLDSGVKSALILPVLVDGEMLGTLSFASELLGHYQEDTVRVVVAIAAVVGMMIANAELQEENEVEANIGRIVSSPLVGPDVFERFAAEAAKIIDFERLALGSVDLQENTFKTEFLFGQTVPDYPIGKIQQIDGSAIELVVRSQTGQRFLLEDRDGMEPKYPHAGPFISAGQQYFLGVPLIVGDQVIGTMGFNRGSRPFSRKDLTKAERLGSLVAGAFADFNLQEYKVQAERELNKNRAILEAEANIGRILSSPMAGADALAALKSALANIIPLDRLGFTAVDLESETFSHGFNEFLHDPEFQFAKNPGQPYAGSITGEVIRSRKGQIINFDDPRLVSGQLPISKLVFEQGYRSAMAVPLVFEETIIGTLVFTRFEGEYSNEDMVTADRIGNLLAGALATFKITLERNRAQLALSESEMRFRQIADSIRGVFWLIELEPRRLIYASPKFEDIWDIPAVDVYDDIGLWMERIHPEDRPRIRHDIARSSETGEVDIEYRIVKRDGLVRWIHSRGFPIRDGNGNVYRMSGIAEDITDRKSELERFTEAGRLLSIGELASGVAHEINNPLASINLYSEVLLGQDLPDSVITDLQVISDQAKRAAAIVRNLLQFARKSSPEISTVSAREFVERCMELKSHDFRINNISASASVPFDLAEIKIDEQLMTQVIVNILNNAEQACVAAHGRGHISVTVREIDGSTRISISDDGPGIPAENLSKVFDPFFTTKDVGEGTGLGLSVSYGIIAQLGGKLWAESDGLTGATFHIEVPPAAAIRTAEPADGEDLPERESRSHLHVLVVDDEPDLRNILVRLLQRNHHTVDQAADGEEAWRKLQDQHFDCVLLDLRMAGTDGQELFQRISSSYPSLADKVIFITGDLANARTRSFLNALSNLVLEKPISVWDLERAFLTMTEKNPR